MPNINLYLSDIQYRLLLGDAAEDQGPGGSATAIVATLVRRYCAKDLKGRRAARKPTQAEL